LNGLPHAPKGGGGLRREVIHPLPPRRPIASLSQFCADPDASLGQSFSIENKKYASNGGAHLRFQTKDISYATTYRDMS
jgi:hypothetical protein